jgi:adenosylcobinamide amidohydrolase
VIQSRRRASASERADPNLTATCVSRFGRWLVVRFGKPHTVTSWAIVGGGTGVANTVAWCQVDERELRPPVDAARWLRARMREDGLQGAVGLLTSRCLDAWVESMQSTGGTLAHCVATVGLGNALRIGDPPGPHARIGTINALVRVDMALTESGQLEALALAAEAKTAAVLEAGLLSRRSGLRATGTGTDCLVVAAPIDPTALGRLPRKTTYVGKHTGAGAAIGAAVFAAVREGVSQWMRDRGLE